MLLFFENPSTLDSEILRRTNNRVSTDKLLAEIFTSHFPNTKLDLKDKSDNTATTLSIQFTPKSVELINKILASEIFKKKISSLRENIFTYQQNPKNIKAHLIRATTCNILNKLDLLAENPSLYQRAINLNSSENILQKIYDKKYKEIVS
jgi:hypothetical protein